MPVKPFPNKDFRVISGFRYNPAMSKPFDLTNERKLTDHDVLVIRAVHVPKHLRFGSVTLAQLFGVSQPTIDRVVKRETYRHLHPLLLPTLRPSGEGRFASTALGGAGDEPGKQARNKTDYADARRWVRHLFSRGDYSSSLRGEFEVDRDGRYISRRAKPRPVTPEVLEQRAQRREQAAYRRLERLKEEYGDAFNERVALAAVGLAPRLSREEFLSEGGRLRAARAAGNGDAADVSRDELIRRFGGQV